MIVIRYGSRFGHSADTGANRQLLRTSTNLQTVRVIGALVIAMTICGGCAVPAATFLPSTLGISPVVVDHLGAGKSDSFWIAQFDDVVQAALRAGNKLSLTLKEQEIEKDRASLRYVDDQDNEISIRIERRTETVTRGRFDVGSSELLGFARLFGRQLIDELNDANAFLVDWSVKERAQPR